MLFLCYVLRHILLDFFGMKIVFTSTKQFLTWFYRKKWHKALILWILELINTILKFVKSNIMKTYKVLKFSNMWSTNWLTKEVEKAINNAVAEGWVVVSVSFGHNNWYVPTGFVTICKDNAFV